MTTTLTRAATVDDFTGRTLEGVAYRYERPSRVSDDHFRTNYFEEIMKRADAKTIGDRPSFPLHRLHDRDVDPIGDVTFHHSDTEDALLFVATVNRSDAGDELLEDEGWRDVSVGFKPLRNSFRQSPHYGKVVQRREIKIVELSVAPTGTGLHKGAEITVVRAAEHSTPLLDHYTRRARLL